MWAWPCHPQKSLYIYHMIYLSHEMDCSKSNSQSLFSYLQSRFTEFVRPGIKQTYSGLLWHMLWLFTQCCILLLIHTHTHTHTQTILSFAISMSITQVRLLLILQDLGQSPSLISPARLGSQTYSLIASSTHFCLIQNIRRPILLLQLAQSFVLLIPEAMVTFTSTRQICS